MATTKACAGWVAHQLKARAPGQCLRIAGRLGLVDENDYTDAMELVYGSTQEMADGHEERETSGTGDACSVVNADCLHPAGWTGGKDNPDADAEHWCAECGDPVCSACSVPYAGAADRGRSPGG